MLDLRLCLILTVSVTALLAQTASESPIISPSSITPALSEREKALNERVRELRSLPDDRWKKEVGALAREIQGLPSSKGKQWLVDGLSSRATEGDAGRAALQTIADTIGTVVSDLPANQRAPLYSTLARLERYEQVKVALDDPAYRAAIAKLEADDRKRQSAQFTLSDLKGQKWTLRDLRGKIVLVNFWATWCPPCRREMPDMQVLHDRYSRKGLVILAISDEDAKTVEPFIAEQKYGYPILLDPEGVVNKRFLVEGIPRTFVYNREGKLIAEATDRRTLGQFLDLLKRAGLE